MKKEPRFGSWWEERGIVAACVAASLLLSAAYTFSARPEFESAAEIQVDPEVGGLATAAWWESESRQLGDAAFLSRVISKYDLAGSPELLAGRMSTPLKRALAMLRTPGEGPRAGAPAPATAALISRLAIRAGTKPDRFEVVVRAYDARFTALAANAIGRTFVEETSSQGSDAADGPGEWVAARLERPADGGPADSALAPSIDPRRPVLEADLAQARARAARAEAEETATKRHLDALRLEASSGTLDGSELGAVDAVQAARRDLTETDARRANLEQSLGPRHPDVVAIHERLRKQRADLAAEVARLVQRAEAAAEASGRAAEATRGSVTAIRAQLSGLRESAASDVATPAPSPAARASGAEPAARFVSAATVPSRPAFPDVARNVEVAAAVGLVLGLLLAHLRARLDSSDEAVGG